MTREKLKALLDSVVREDERDFKIVYSSLKPARKRGLYSWRDGAMTLYPKCYANWTDLIGAAIHELGHHVHWARKKDSLLSRLHQGKRICHHGAEFKAILDELIRAFNFRYQGRLKAFLTYNRRRPKVPPRFESLIVRLPVPQKSFETVKAKVRMQGRITFIAP